MDTLPDSSIELINKLNTLIPSRHPNLNESEREIWFNAGRRSVVDFLLSLSKRKENLEDDN
jgi:hypothetical protein